MSSSPFSSVCTTARLPLYLGYARRILLGDLSITVTSRLIRGKGKSEGFSVRRRERRTRKVGALVGSRRIISRRSRRNGDRQSHGHLSTEIRILDLQRQMKSKAESREDGKYRWVGDVVGRVHDCLADALKRIKDFMQIDICSRELGSSVLMTSPVRGRGGK
jgi:hypothetical protein